MGHKLSRGYSIKFYLPKEAESLDVISVHSSNYENYNILYQNTRLIVKITKQSGRSLRKKYGTPGRFVPITFGHYSFRYNYEGLTTIEITPETRGVSPKDLKDLFIRFGVSIKINLKDKYKGYYEQIYEQIIENSKFLIADETPTQVDLSRYIKANP